MSEQTSGTRVRLRAIEGGLSPPRDSVARLHEFQGDHPEVAFKSPRTGPYGQFTALIPAGISPGEDREIILKSPDLCGVMDQLEDLFRGPPEPA